MKFFKPIRSTVLTAKKSTQKYVEEYVLLNLETKQLILTQKAVLLLCQQAEHQVEQLQSLEPDLNEGLIATIESKKIRAVVHFTPDKITIQESCIKGQLRLLNSSQFYSKSPIYRCLIEVWKNFLGGNMFCFPENIEVKGDNIYYTFPRNYIKLLEYFLSNQKNGSALVTFVREGKLIIETSLTLSWTDLIPIFKEMTLNKEGITITQPRKEANNSEASP
jgi:hypothetical protein